MLLHRLGAAPLFDVASARPLLSSRTALGRILDRIRVDTHLPHPTDFGFAGQSLISRKTFLELADPSDLRCLGGDIIINQRLRRRGGSYEALPGPASVHYNDCPFEWIVGFFLLVGKIRYGEYSNHDPEFLKKHGSKVENLDFIYRTGLTRPLGKISSLLGRGLLQFCIALERARPAAPFWLERLSAQLLILAGFCRAAV